MNLAKNNRPGMVRVCITLPPELESFCIEKAEQEHFGNISAYIRSVMQKEKRRQSNRSATKPQPALVA